MAHLAYRRDDLLIRMTRTPSGGAIIRAALREGGDQREIGNLELAPWLRTPPGAAITTRLSPLHWLWKLMAEWVLKFEEEWHADDALPRIVLNIDDPELAALDWEHTFGQWLPPPYFYPPGAPIVRSIPVRCAAAERPLSLPLRLLQIGTRPGPALADLVLPLFRGHDPQRVARALTIETTSFGQVRRSLARGDLDQVDVVHFASLPLPADAHEMLSTALPSQAGTLGWFLHLQHMAQPRLLVIECRNALVLARARRLATALTARGGPAVLAVNTRGAGAEPDTLLLHGFYAKLVHNYPLDAALRLALSHDLQPQAASLFVGAGREEALRPSRYGEQLKASVEAALYPSSPDVDAPRAHRLANLQSMLAAPGRTVSAISPLDAFSQAAHQYLAEWPDLQFERHEGEGLLPLADNVAQMRAALAAAPRAPYAYYELFERARYVNSALWAGEDEGSLRLLDQHTARLALTEICHLEVHIGPEDVRVTTAGAVALPEELAFRWQPGMLGVEVEVAVTGLDFEVIGDPVRSLWLPRHGRSEPVYFALLPKTTPVAALRFCVYHRQNLIQSFRLAALTRQTPDEPDPPEKQRRAAIASALGLKASDVDNLGYLPRLEYSIVESPDALPFRPSRALSLVANDRDGVSVITAKGEDTFSVSTPGDLEGDVEAIRATLRQIATDASGATPIYSFGLQGDMNRGEPAQLQSALVELATYGRALYTRVIQSAADRQRIEHLLRDPGVIHVAHILIDKVIPWAAIYDREFDANAQDAQGRPVTLQACTAAIHAPTSEWPALRCGDHPDCLLNPARQAALMEKGQDALRAETVACPLHFWGFRHIVEVPAQQVAPQAVAQPQAAAQPLRHCITCTIPIQVAAGLNRTLERIDTHLPALEALCSKPQFDFKHAFRRDAVKQLLAAPALDLLYFYCHAQQSKDADGRIVTVLEFQEKGDAQPGRLADSDLSDFVWQHHPLVFVNGCRTAGFSPRALSKFVTAFMGREAAGVIGTEIEVWEPLAETFAQHFLADFLAGTQAGEAMRAARLALLAKNNPLGLAYTLYAAAELALDTDFDGKCR
jgi:hypothetical protein